MTAFKYRGYGVGSTVKMSQQSVNFPTQSVKQFFLFRANTFCSLVYIARRSHIQNGFLYFAFGVHSKYITI